MLFREHISIKSTSLICLGILFFPYFFLYFIGYALKIELKSENVRLFLPIFRCIFWNLYFIKVDIMDIHNCYIFIANCVF